LVNGRFSSWESVLPSFLVETYFLAVIGDLTRHHDAKIFQVIPGANEKQLEVLFSLPE
jgi:hypothetical protein